MLYGLVLMSCCSSTVQIKEKLVPVYRKPVHSCIKPGKMPSCIINEGNDNYKKFNNLIDCIVERKKHIQIMRNYITCLEKSFSGENNV